MRINRIIHPGFWFGKSDIKQAVALARAGVGGFCVYGGTVKEVKELITELRANAPHQIIISADYEDGLGRWLNEMPLLPSNISIGATRNKDLAYKKGLITACQAKELGIDWVLAPVVDLADTPQNPIVNTRAFGKNPGLVSEMANYFILGLQDGGCINTLKHFPGHGDTDTDSHLSLPAINKTLKEMKDAELIPYKQLVTRADSIMVSHLLVKKWDADFPASFSEKIMNGFIRKELYYKGLIVTDALMMGASSPFNPVDAFKAGADILLAPADPQKLIEDLAKTIAGNHALSHRAADAISRQEFILAKINSLIPRQCKEAENNRESLSLETALEGIVLKGEAVKLRKGAAVHYLEPDNYPSKDYQAGFFLEELRKNNIKVKPYEEGDKPAVLISVNVRSYGAFRGYVNFNGEQKKLLNKAIAESKESVLISFGSPFVDADLKGLTSFLMAGTRTKPFQETAAKILLGIEQAKGKMPV